MTIETTTEPTSTCCPRVRSWGCIGCYLGPLTYEFGLSLRSILYFGFMIWFSLGLAIYTTVTTAVFTALFAPFCIGVPLLYLNSEILIGLVRFLILAPTYGLLEQDKQNVQNTVYLSVQNGMPLCNTWCEAGKKLSRPKYIFTSFAFYKMLFYNILISPVCTWVLGSSVILVAPPLYLMHHVFRYPFNSSWYKNKNECYGNQNGNKHCHGWLISNFGDCFALFLIGLLILPLTLKLVNKFAQYNKNVCYYFLTNYYNPKAVKIIDEYYTNDVGEDDNSNGKGSVQLNEQYNVQFLSGNGNYNSVNQNQNDNLVSV